MLQSPALVATVKCQSPEQTGPCSKGHDHRLTPANTHAVTEIVKSIQVKSPLFIPL